MFRIFKLARNAIYIYKKNAFGKYLLFTNVISSGIPMFLGDLLQQELEYQQEQLPTRYDNNRLIKMLVVGLASGPFHHYFYLGLSKYLPQRNLKSIFTKIMLDQFFMGPLSIIIFFGGLGVLDRKPFNNIESEIKKKFVKVYLVDWCVWPPAQFINFYFVPVSYQVLYINLVTLLYNTFLSFVKHRETALEYKQKIKEQSKKQLC